MLHTPPQDFRAGAVAPTASHTPAALGDPGDGLASRRRLGRRRGDPMDSTIQRRPCVGLHQHAPGGIRDGTRQHGGGKIRHASTRSSAQARRQRSAFWHGRAARRHPLCNMRCQTARPQRHASPWTRARASSTVSTATGVHTHHALGSTSAGGSPAQTWTAHSVRAAPPSA